MISEATQNEILGCDQEGLDQVLVLLKRRRRELDLWQVMAIRIGQRVSWHSKGRKYLGTVVGTSIRTAKVQTDDGIRWRVAPKFLALEP